MANSNAIHWRIRTDGSELNGGGFDPSITGAGTDYTDQASPQLSLTDLATAGISASVSSVTGGFTAAMIGNMLRIASGTNFTAGYYTVTAVTDSNNATLDRNCCTAAASAGVCRLGGAFASMKSFASSATGSQGTPTLTTPLLPGHRIYIRGDGTEDPSVVQYDWALGGTWTLPDGQRSAAGSGDVHLIGYNGRPIIGHGGFTLKANNWVLKNLSLKRTAGTNTTSPFMDNTSGGGVNTVQFCIFDQAGYDAPEYRGEYGHVLFCEFRNSGGGAAGSTPVCQVTHPGSAVYGCYFHGLRGPAVATGYSTNITTFTEICYNYIADCLSDGIVVEVSAAPYCYGVFNNTIHNNGGHGIHVKASGIACSTIFNNLITGHVGSGKYGLYFVDNSTTNRRLKRNFIGFNCYFGNTNDVGNWQRESTDLTVDPGYADSASHDFATGDSVQGVGVSGLSGYLGSAPNLINIGAYQGIPVGGATLIGARLIVPTALVYGRLVQ